MSPKMQTEKPKDLDRCNSCNGVIDPHNGECRCS